MAIETVKENEMKKILLPLLLALFVEVFAENQIHIIDDTLHPSDASEFAEMIEGFIWTGGIDDVLMSIIIQETVYNDIEFTVVYMQRVGSTGYRDLYYSDNEYCRSLVLSAVVACGWISKNTSWHSDDLSVRFQNEWHNYSTQECREIADMFSEHSIDYINVKIEEYVYVVKR